MADATVLAAYEEDYIKGTAAVTSKAYGDGMAYYVACRLSEKDMQYIYEKVYADNLLTDKNVDGTLELEGCQVAVLKIE